MNETWIKCLFSIVFLVETVLSASFSWHRTKWTGSNSGGDVIFTVKVRSVIECCAHCTSNSNCDSFKYENSTNICTALSVSEQNGPFVINSNAFLYSKFPNLGCPIGYDLLPIYNACVKPYPDYLTWNESRTSCQSQGTDLPILDTNEIFDEFRIYMDSRTAIVDNRVAVGGFLLNNVAYWTNGKPVDISKFCSSTPDMLNTPDICLWMAFVNEEWCGSITNRLDDAPCSTFTLRICVLKLL